ncbi:MAG: 50S ribosomal protein L32 [Chloroflexi bacterium]|nr:50S ribosomal protein L32 [Chloroflexota bacterium]
MTEPKRKTSKRKTGTRQSHQAYSAPSLSVCPQCHSPKPPHRVCPVCGTYKGREVYEVKKGKG